MALRGLMDSTIRLTELYDTLPIIAAISHYDNEQRMIMNFLAKISRLCTMALITLTICVLIPGFYYIRKLHLRASRRTKAKQVGNKVHQNFLLYHLNFLTVPFNLF